MVFSKQWGINYLQEQLWAKVQKHSSTCSGQNIKTMILAKLVTVLKMLWCFVNNGGIIFRDNFGPRAKDTLAQWFLSFYIQLPTLQSDISKLPTFNITSYQTHVNAVAY